MCVVANAVIDPRAVVIHVDDAALAGRAVPDVGRHEGLASVALLFYDSVDSSVAASAKIKRLVGEFVLLDKVVHDDLVFGFVFFL